MRINYAQAVFGEPEKQAVAKSLENSFLSVGPNSQEFEEKVATLFNKKYGVFVNSGSSANLLVSQLIPKGEVITPALTFATTLTPLLQCGLTPVFIDSGKDTYLPSLEDIKTAVTDKTTAVMVPDLLGNRMDFKALREFCDEKGLMYIQDSCDTLAFNSGGHFVTTSFYGSHIITAMGGGGMVMGDDKEAMDRIRTMRDWGRGVDVSEKISDRYAYDIDGIPYDGKFVYTERGFNMRPIDAMAAFGLEQFRRLPEFIVTRQNNFNELYDFFAQYPYIGMPVSQGNPNWLALPLTISPEAPFTRFELVDYLEKNDIQTRPIFSGNVTRHKAFREYSADFPNADYIMEHGVLLGIHQGLGKEELDYIKQTYENFVNGIVRPSRQVS